MRTTVAAIRAAFEASGVEFSAGGVLDVQLRKPTP